MRYWRYYQPFTGSVWTVAEIETEDEAVLGAAIFPDSIYYTTGE